MNKKTLFLCAALSIATLQAAEAPISPVVTQPIPATPPAPATITTIQPTPTTPATKLVEAYTKIHEMYVSKVQEVNNSETSDLLTRKVKKISQLLIKFKQTSDKNNIFKEALEIFYDESFSKNLVNNPYLLCFENGVYDFKNKEFRDGRPTDYISKCTNKPYIPMSVINSDVELSKIKTEINVFMSQIMPRERTCKYMWEHLASTLIGVKKEHAFNMYKGTGSNGKSLLTDMMSHGLGDYKGIVPITLITDKRSSIGSATPEIMALKGIRYAVMQEPSTEVVMNEGIMKELTGGDPLIGRALYCGTEIFIPQFSLVVCTNASFIIKAKEDGTWRRMKQVDFISKFADPDEFFTDDTSYVFTKDKSLKDKLPAWAPVFMSMLIEIAIKTDGVVIDCPEVVEATKKYRESQDSVMEFINTQTIPHKSDEGVTETTIYNRFKEWIQDNNNSKCSIKKKDVISEIVKKYGSIKGKQIFNGLLFLGYTKQMALDSWGEPEYINKTTTKAGIHEQWVYDTLNHKYLYFDNGILTTIQE